MTAAHKEAAVVLAEALQHVGGEGRSSVLSGLAHGMLLLVVETLERQAHLVARLQHALGVGALRPAEVSPSRFMSVKEYATHSRLCERTVRSFVREGMTRGVHYHRDGRTGRRVIIHVSESDAWRSARIEASEGRQTVAELATNEVLRQRARAALRKRRG